MRPSRKEPMSTLTNENFASPEIKKLKSFQRNTPFEGMIMKGFGANKCSALLILTKKLSKLLSRKIFDQRESMQGGN